MVQTPLVVPTASASSFTAIPYLPRDSPHTILKKRTAGPRTIRPWGPTVWGQIVNFHRTLYTAPLKLLQIPSPATSHIVSFHLLHLPVKCYLPPDKPPSWHIPPLPYFLLSPVNDILLVCPESIKVGGGVGWNPQYHNGRAFLSTMSSLRRSISHPLMQQ